MGMEGREAFERHVKGRLAEKREDLPVMFKVYKGALVTKTYPVVRRAGGARIELDEAFPYYMEDACIVEVGGEYIVDDHLAFSYYRGACGYFMVFVTRDILEPSLVKFGSYTEGGRRRHCVLGDFIEGGGGRQELMMTGVPIRLCAACSKPLGESYKCSRCRAGGVHVRYCGEACQKAHWGVHGPVRRRLARGV